ncbi:MAG: Na-K-Cl cotransporter [Deltaproteobacteria bacterium]|nr:Na-K-Cl cotransporter [Deltaproteobacteria bacterium]
MSKKENQKATGLKALWPFPRGPARPADGKLGTFLGVYLPTILTILGVIMYLRFGWVIGHMGLWKTLAIVLIANSITFITALSFSAVATNIRVGVGGAYYMISRSLGLEIGGAIGLPLFLSQAFSVTLYAFGLAESLRILWPGVPVQIAAFIIVAAVGALALKGAAMALKVQIPLLVLIVISIIALIIGVAEGNVATMMGPETEEAATNPGFWGVFAVFFPAVTGIMAGLGLSGDLRDPGKSIPVGAITATLTGLMVYLGIPFLLVVGATDMALRSEPMIWTKIAPLGAVAILPGLWGAIFSSAVGSVLGAPRTLQALAIDSLAPKALEGKPEQSEPILGLVVTMVIALGAVFLGELNAVALVVSMFFLTVYGMVNLVAALEQVSGDPSWRPKLRVHWALSLVGGVACFAVMFLIHAPAAAAAIGVELLLWLALDRREREAEWGDARRGMYEALIRWSLFRLAARPLSARNWRPHVLVFTENLDRRLDLVRFGTWFSQGRGVVTICELVVGDLLDPRIDPAERRMQMRRSLDREGLVAFAEVDVVEDVISGMAHVAQANGMAGLHSNTVMVGWPSQPERVEELMHVVQRLDRLQKSVILGRIQAGMDPRHSHRREIHVWWGGLQRNGDLMLLLAHLLKRNPEWRNVKIRVLSLASNDHMKEQTERHLEQFLPEIRIDAKCTVRLLPEGERVSKIIHEESAEADVVFLGLQVPKPGREAQAVERMQALAEGLRTVFFVRNSSLFGGELVSASAEAPAKEP